MPGARVPHAWIKPLDASITDETPALDVSYVKEFTAGEIAARQYSTLDLCGMDVFTLIASRAEPWTQRVEELQTSLASRNIKVQLWVAGVDFEFTGAEQKALFEKDGGFATGGALLVRPDQHLLQCPSIGTTAGELQSLVLEHLGL